MSKHIYLAGPEVFLPNAGEVARRKQAICAESGFEGVFPLDAEVDLAGLGPREAGLSISRANEGLIRSCDLLIANLTPFRGPSADVGVAYELGFMRALGRPVFAYTNDPRSFTARTIEAVRARRVDGRWIDTEGLSIEDYGLVDNLMIDGAVLGGGGDIIRGSVPYAERFTNLEAFAECVRRVRRAIEP